MAPEFQGPFASSDQPDISSIETRWIEESNERCRQIDAGEVTLLDGAEVLRELQML